MCSVCLTINAPRALTREDTAKCTRNIVFCLIRNKPNILLLRCLHVLSSCLNAGTVEMFINLTQIPGTPHTRCGDVRPENGTLCV